jgi:hypothetical protein
MTQGRAKNHLIDENGDAFGTSANPLKTGNEANSQLDGHSQTIGSTGDADTANTIVGRLKQIITRLSGGLPAALVGGKLDVNIGTWLGASTPSVGQKAMAASVPVVLPSDQTVSVSSGATEEATFTVVASAVVLGNGKSLISLYNPSASTKVLKLREYYMRNAQTSAVTGVAAQLEIRKIVSGTAPTGGTDLTASIVAHDSNDTLGAGILAHAGATLTGEVAIPYDLMRISSDEWGPGTLDQEGAQQTISNYLPARVKRDAQQKPLIVMRAGQGATLKCVTNTTAGSFDLIFVFTQV